MSKPKILFVDDEINFASSMKRQLEPKFDVRRATSVADAMRALKTAKDYSAVVLDMMIPGSQEANAHPAEGIRILDGMDEGSLPNLPVIVYSDYLTELQSEFGALGAASVLKKESASADIVSEAIENAITTSGRQGVRKPRASAADIDIIRKIVEEAFERNSPNREKTLHIPGEGNFELIKPLVGFKRDIESRLSRFPYGKNVFLMMKFRDSNADLSKFIIDGLEEHGFVGVRADDNNWNITRDVYNPVAVLYCCKFGIALFDEAEELQAYSPNVAYELGMMHSHRKDCLILKHAALPHVPFDLIKDLHVEYDRDLRVRPIIATWIEQTAKSK